MTYLSYQGLVAKAQLTDRKLADPWVEVPSLADFDWNIFSRGKIVGSIICSSYMPNSFITIKVL